MLPDLADGAQDPADGALGGRRGGPRPEGGGEVGLELLDPLRVGRQAPARLDEQPGEDEQADGEDAGDRECDGAQTPSPSSSSSSSSPE